MDTLEILVKAILAVLLSLSALFFKRSINKTGNINNHRPFLIFALAFMFFSLVVLVIFLVVFWKP